MTRYTPDYRRRRERIFQLRKERRFEEALREVDALEADGADTPDLRVDRADILARLGRPAEALDVLDRRPVDLVITEVEDVRQYEDLFRRLCEAAMPPEKSTDLLIKIARSVAERPEGHTMRGTS